jgi:hypothetical protein
MKFHITWTADSTTRLFEFGNTYHAYQQGNYTETTVLGAVGKHQWLRSMWFVCEVLVTFSVWLALRGLVGTSETDGIALNAGDKIADLDIVSLKFNSTSFRDWYPSLLCKHLFTGTENIKLKGWEQICYRDFPKFPNCKTWPLSRKWGYL